MPTKVIRNGAVR